MLIAGTKFIFSIFEKEGTVGACPFGANPVTWYIILSCTRTMARVVSHEIFAKDKLVTVIDSVQVYSDERIETVWKMDDCFSKR